MDKDPKKNCFGILDTVFPMAEDGLRYTPDECFECSYKTECLRSALIGKGGLKVQEEFVDRSYKSGMIGFLERWSKKKELFNKRSK